MKVTIQRTINLNEIPLQINKMINDCVQELDTVSKVATTVECANPEAFLEQIDFLRRNLFSIDNKLEEASALMKGFQQANDPAEPQAAPVSQKDLPNGMPAELYEQTLKKMEEVSKLMEETSPSDGDTNEQ